MNVYVLEYRFVMGIHIYKGFCGCWEKERMLDGVIQNVSDTGPLQTEFDFFRLCNSLICLQYFRFFSSSLFTFMFSEHSNRAEKKIKKGTGCSFPGRSCQARFFRGRGQRMIDGDISPSVTETGHPLL